MPITIFAQPAHRLRTVWAKWLRREPRDHRVAERAALPIKPDALQTNWNATVLSYDNYH